MKATQEGLGTVESSQNTSVESGPTNDSKPWDLPLRFFSLFIEALGRCSEEYYVYLPVADEPKNHDTSNYRRDLEKKDKNRI